MSGRQVVQDKTMEDSDDSDSEDSEDSEGSEDSEDSDGDYNTNFTCEGKPYKVKGRALTCYLHSLLYEIECNRIAEKANEVIDPVMGKGHSNLPESKLSVLTKFRPKNTVEVIKKRSKMASLACLKARKFMNLGYRRDRLDMT